MNNFLANFSKTVGKANIIDEFLKWPLVLQKCIGIQVLDPDWDCKRHNIVHHIFNILLYVYVFFGTLKVLRYSESTEVIAEATYTLILTFICPIKSVIFIQNRKQLQDLYVTAKSNLYAMVYEHNPENFNAMLKNIKRLTNSVVVLALSPLMYYELVVLIKYIQGQRVLLSISTESLMPMTSPYFEIAWILHSIFMINVSCTAIVLDMWFVLLTYVFCNACDGLHNILHVVPSNVLGDIYENTLEQRLKLFYDSNLILVRFLQTLFKMYKFLALVPLMFAAMSICVILLATSSEINFHLGLHFVPLFGEVLVYNWCGELIKSKMHKLRHGLICFDWLNLGIKTKKKYLITMTYFNKNFGVQLGNGSELSLIFMTTVLKLSYQAFTVLKTLEK